MKISIDDLISGILDFMAVLYECYIGTTYSQDRNIYAKDIAMAMGWIVELRKSGNVEGLIETILSPNTDKYFGDYWRQGEWGDKQAKALGAFKNSLRSI